jgi:hypothetical protein
LHPGIVEQPTEIIFSAACWPFKFEEDSTWRAWRAEKGNEENLEWTGIFG